MFYFIKIQGRKLVEVQFYTSHCHNSYEFGYWFCWHLLTKLILSQDVSGSRWLITSNKQCHCFVRFSSQWSLFKANTWGGLVVIWIPWSWKYTRPQQSWHDDERGQEMANLWSRRSTSWRWHDCGGCSPSWRWSGWCRRWRCWWSSHCPQPHTGHQRGTPRGSAGNASTYLQCGEWERHQLRQINTIQI